jgi:hypothetical protein
MLEEQQQGSSGNEMDEERVLYLQLDGLGELFRRREQSGRRVEKGDEKTDERKGS